MDQTEEEESSIEEYFDEKIKLMVLGDSSVGKSSILTKYCKNKFLSKYVTTIGIDFQIKYLNINKKKIKVQIWDTAGQERYRVVTKNYFNSSNGFVIIYDITNRVSFNNINNWMEQIESLVGKDVKCILFGNKNDLVRERSVKKEEGKELAKKYNCPFFETSAKEGNNIEAGFKCIIMDIIRDIQNSEFKRNDSKVLKPNRIKEKKNCC
jgi:small GTP-binding protein